uniref:Uncharacterized protein n=1 Tax=Romanomermis culicivorax TaxID=13658 RepID=A0A915I8W8_ROMCU
MTHRLDMLLLNFTDIGKFVIVPHVGLDNKNDMKIKFYHNDTEIFIHMKKGAESLELSFGDGISIKYGNGYFYTNQLFPKSKARLWYDYNRIINLCNKLGIKFRAYSERDQESFTLTNETIQFDLLEMKLSIFETSDKENPPVKQIKCNQGYNIVLIKPTCCTNLTAIINDGAKVFQVVILELEHNMHELGLDLTLVTDAIDEWNTPYYLEIEPIVHHSSMVLLINMIVREEITPYRIGAIRLNDVISLENYKKVKVSAKSDFILEYNNTSMTPKVTPLPRVICPFSPIVVLNPFVVERGQTILFNDRIMTNYDLVELDNSTLLITNMVSDMMQMFILKEEDVPLLTIIIEHYKSEQMKNTKLKFEHGIELDLNNLNGHEIINYFTFKLKIHLMSKHIDEEGLIMQRDLRFNAGGNIMSL